MDKLEGTYSVRSCGAAANGRRDDTVAIQEAIDKAAIKGGNVFLPPGSYRVKGTIEVHPGVALYGIHDAPCGFKKLAGSVLLPIGGKGDADGPPLFHLHESSMIRGISVHYPEQDINDIQPYPFTFHMDCADNTIENITLINSYQAVRVGPGENYRHRIRHVYGCALRHGIVVESCRDGGRVEECHFHPHWWSQAEVGGDEEKAREYMGANFEAFTFGGAHREKLIDCSVQSARTGWRFLKNEAGACSGHFNGCAAEGCRNGILVEAAENPGLLFTGGVFSTVPAEEACPLRVTESRSGAGVRFNNCAFYAHDGVAAEFDGEGFAALQSCQILRNASVTNMIPAVRVNKGRLQLTSSSFIAPTPHLELREGIQHAIVTGNNGTDGFAVLDFSGGRTIFGENEPSSVKATL